MREEIAMEEKRDENPYQEEVNAFWVMAEDIYNALLKVGVDLFAPLPDEPLVVDRRMRKMTPAVRRHWIALLRQLDESYPSEPDFHPHEVAAQWELELVQREAMELARGAVQKAREWIEARMLAEQEASRAADIETVRKAKQQAKESGTPLDPKARELDHELRAGRARGEVEVRSTNGGKRVRRRRSAQGSPSSALRAPSPRAAAGRRKRNERAE